MIGRIAGRALLVAVALLACAQTALADTSTSFPNVVFSDGFESGTLGSWANVGIGSTTVVAAAARAGSDGLRFANASGQYGVVQQSLPSPVSDSSTSFYVRVGSDAGVQTVAQARDSGNGTQYRALLYDGSQHGFWFYPRIGASAVEIFTGRDTAAAGAWIKVEVRYTATSTGGAQLLLDDATQAGWGASGDLSGDGGYQRLQLWNDVANTTDFDDVQVATPPAALPGAPAGVGGTPGTGSVALTWTAGADGGSPITGYRITPSTGGTSLPSISTGSDATSYLVTGLTNGSPYTFTVAAANGTGTGPDSAPSPPITPAVSNAIQTENSLPGDPSWGDFAAPPDPTGIAGYGSKISVNHGQSLDLYVTTTAANVSLDVFRLGWYGGAGARKMASLGTFPGVNQTQATPNPTTGMVEEHWSRTTTLNVPTSWTTGLYLVRLLASNGYGGYIMFVVRDDGGHEPVLLQASVDTYQAYNPYGGTSLYNNNTDHSIYTGPHATKVSFDRPFQTGNGAGQVLWYEYPFLRWLEKNGYDVAYTSDVDTHEGTSTITDHKAFLEVGHDEYWSKAMRDNVEGAIAAGVNVGFFGANEAWWQVRMEPSTTGVPDRVEVGYKDFADCACAPGPDPMWNVDNSVLTGLFRNPLTNRPEERMLGNQYGGETFNSDYIVQNASNWVYAGTGWTNGTHVSGLVGYEYNHYYGDATTPPGTVVLSNTPLVNTEHANQPDTANATIYTAPSGATVFSAATIQWSWGLDGFGGTSMVNAGVQRVTRNIVDTFTSGAPPPAPTPPGAPTGVTGTAQNAAVGLTWSAPASDGGAPITGYRITPSSGGVAQPAVLTGSSDTSFVVTGLTNGTAYTFTIAAINSAGSGSDSAASAPVTPLALPGPPTAVVGTAGNGQVALTWTAPSSDGGSAITGYRVTPSIGGSTQTPILTGSTATTSTVTGLTNGTAYTFTVAAINASGTGPDSTASAAVTPMTVPSAPSAVGGTPADSAVALAWTAPASNGGGPILRYTITPSIGGVAQTPVQTTSAGSSFVVTGLTNGTAYTFTVAAVNAAGAGPDSAASALVTPAAGQSGGGTTVFSDDFESGSTSSWANTGVGTVTVSAASAHAGSYGLRLSNAASQYDVLAKTLASALPDSITSFWVRVASAGGFETIAQARDSTSGAVDWSLLYDSASQQFWFYPFNGTSASEISTGANSAPIGGWMKVDVRYTVGASGGAQLSLNGQTQPAWGVSGNFAAAASVQRLQLWNDAANSTDFDDVSVSTPAPPVTVPGAPSGLTGTAGDASAALSWTAPSSDGGSAITGYRITPFVGTTAQTPTITSTAVTTATVTGLTNGTAYTFTVAAINAAGTGAASAASGAVTPVAAPGAPTGVAGTAGDGSAALTWTAPSTTGGSPVTSYLVTEYVGGVAQPVLLDTGSTATSFTVTGLTNGTAYTFTVSAINGAGTGPESTQSAPITPRTVPGAPTAVAGTPGNGQVALTWTVPASTGGSAITGYRVTAFIGTTAQTPQLTGSTAASFTVAGLTNGTAYTFTVAAINAVGTGADSAASAQVTPRTVPGAPTAVGGTAGNASVALTWTAPASNGGSAITGYRVTPFIGTTAQTAQLTGSAATSFTATGLTNGTAYTFKVAAINAAGTGADSTASAQVTPVTVPGAPTAVAGTPGNGQVALTWTAPASNGGSAITGYRVTAFIGTTAQTPQLTGSTATSFTVTGLTNGTAYTFTVAAITAVGTGADSAASPSITPRTVPGAPTAVAGTPGNGQVALTWTAPASNGGSAITGYRVTPFIGTTAQTAQLTGSAATSFTATGLTNGTAYTFKVAAINAAGTGADSTASAQVTPRTVPGAPTAVAGTPGNGQVALTWTAPASNGGSAITGYRVTPFIGATAQTAVLTGSTATSFTVTGLTNGTAYTFTVAAINAAGTGADSTASALVTPRTVPGAPTGVSGLPAGSGRVALTWTAPASNGGSAITGYRVTPFVGTTAQTAQLTGSIATTYTVTGLTNGTAYTFRVAAINAAGAGADSTASAAVTAGPRLIQSVTRAVATTATPASAFTSNVTTGNTLVAVFAAESAGGRTVTSVTDTLGNTWTRAVRNNSDTNGDDIEIWFAVSRATGADTVTAHVGPGALQENVTVAELAGGATLDVTAGAPSAGTSHSSGNTAAAAAGDVVLGAYVDRGFSTTNSISDSKTQLGSSIGSTTATESNQSYALNTAAGAQSAAFRSTATTIGAVVVAAFKPQ